MSTSELISVTGCGTGDVFLETGYGSVLRLANRQDLKMRAQPEGGEHLLGCGQRPLLH